MCNFMGVRVTKIQFITLKQIEKELGTLAALAELELMKDGFRYSNSLIIRRAADNNDIEVVKAHWEFIPHWVKDMDAVKAARKQGIPWLNAKGETILSSKMFRSAALKRRCLVLATHFFDWRHYQPEGEKKPIAYPYNIGVNDKDYFYMAGIWQPWTDKSTGETMDTFAVVTTEANELMTLIHNTKKRMPTILTEDLAYEWIMNDLTEERIQQIASYQIPSENMWAHTIKKDFKTQEEPCVEYTYDELPELDLAL
ncbi:MAG: SOS response-associated peptidase family protein [Bacteroidota bacterium]